MARQLTGLECLFQFLSLSERAFCGLPIREQMAKLQQSNLGQIAFLKNSLGVPELYPPHFFRLNPAGRSVVNMSNFFAAHLKGRGGGQIYSFAERFTRHLERTTIDLPCEMLPAPPGFSCAIELPYGFKAPDDAFHHSAIISMLPGEANDPANPWDRTMLITLLDFDETGAYVGVDTQVTVRLLRGESLEAMVDECDERRPWEEGLNWLPCNRPVINMLAKCLLYIRSEEPDIQPVPVTVCHSQKGKKLRQHAREFCPLPLINVGYGFHGRHQHVDEASVRGHFRWQPWGEGRSKVKLIWIEEHVRRYGALPGVPVQPTIEAQG